MTELTTQATLLEPRTGKPLAKISLVDAPIQTDSLISTHGCLQGFTILTNPAPLWEAWFNQKAVLLRTDKTQQLIRIVTYPTAGEREGHLDFIPGTVQRFMDREQPRYRTKPQPQRWMALLQSLLSI